MIFLVTACQSDDAIWRLPDFPSMPYDARVVAVHPNYEYRALDFIVESKTFAPTDEGCAIMVEKIPATQATLRAFPNPFLK